MKGTITERIVSWRQLLYRLGLAAGGLVFLYQVWNSCRTLSERAVSLLSPQILLMVGALDLLALGLQITAWVLVMRSLGVRLVWAEALRGYVISFLPRYVPGTVWGYLSRGEWLFSSHSVPYYVTNVGSAIELLATVTANLLGIAVYATWRFTGQFRLIFLLGAAMLPLGSWVVLRQVLGSSFVKGHLGGGSTEGSHGTVTVMQWCRILVIDMLVWICYGVALEFTETAFGLDNTPLLETMGWFNAAWLIGLVIVFVPTGFGVREMALANFLTAGLGLHGGEGNVLAVTSRFMILVTECTGVAIGLVLRRARSANRHAMHR